MCACSFDMCFTFVMAGWEGTANDARVILETVTRRENLFPMPEENKYYVVDSGYQNFPGFLTPYRGDRYHIRDFQNNGPPEGIEELFNFRHSSLRNVIERCFGVLKARFPILTKMPPYPVKTQKYIPLACCALHNFVRTRDRNDRLFEMYGNEEMIVNDGVGTNSQNPIEIDISRSQQATMSVLRDQIAGQIWRSYNES